MTMGFTPFKGFVILFRLNVGPEGKAPNFVDKISEKFGEDLHHLLIVDDLNDPGISNSFKPNDMLKYIKIFLFPLSFKFDGFV